MSRAFSAWRAGFAVAALTLLLAIPASATIDGLAGGTYALAAREGYISTADGGSYYCWGYANGPGGMQFPGPTLIVDQGQVVTITLTNAIPHPLASKVSLVFPGQTDVRAVGRHHGAPRAGGHLRRRFGDLHLHRQPAGDLPLPQRDEPRAPVRDGPGRAPSSSGPRATRTGPTTMRRRPSTGSTSSS